MARLFQLYLFLSQSIVAFMLIFFFKKIYLFWCNHLFNRSFGLSYRQVLRFIISFCLLKSCKTAICIWFPFSMRVGKESLIQGAFKIVLFFSFEKIEKTLATSHSVSIHVLSFSCRVTHTNEYNILLIN